MDKRALRILHSTYWSLQGWKPFDSRDTPPDDLLYAKEAGAMCMVCACCSLYRFRFIETALLGRQYTSSTLTSQVDEDTGGRTVNAAIMSWLFGVPPEPRSAWSIIGWWELRRVLYNLALYLVGLVTYGLFVALMSLMLEPGEDAVEPVALFAGVVLANVAFTGGWVVELLVRLICRDRYPYLGPTLLKLGLVFTLAVLLLPSVGAGAAWLVRCVMGAARW
jgi:hypothetical protein